MRLVSTATAIAAVCAALPAFATTYHIVDLGANTTANGVNSRGHVSGQSAAKHAALYIDGTWHEYRDGKYTSAAGEADRDGDMIGAEHLPKGVVYPMYYPRGKTHGERIPLPGGNVAGDQFADTLGGISADGRHVVGAYVDQAAGRVHCFEWTPGDPAAVDIGLPAGGYDTCDAYDVDKSGDIVGQVYGDSPSFAAFVYHDGTFTLMGQGTGDVLLAVNAAGHAVGADPDPAVGAIYWNGTTLAPIPPQGALKMYSANAIDYRDTIAGSGLDGRQDTLLLYADGTLTDLLPLIDNPEGWDFFFPQVAGMNDSGVIVGNDSRDGGVPHAFMLVPD